MTFSTQKIRIVLSERAKQTRALPPGAKFVDFCTGQHKIDIKHVRLDAGY